jgi:hypothetical protein
MHYVSWIFLFLRSASLLINNKQDKNTYFILDAIF